MPPRGKGPRLWLRAARRDACGRVTHPAAWIVKDGGHQRGTGCGADDRAGAERELAAYISHKHLAQVPQRQRRPPEIPVAEVLARYADEIAPRHADPKETARRIKALLGFYGDKTLAAVNGSTCRAYTATRSSDAVARRELEDLRAAIGHFHREGHMREIVKVVLPPRRPPRERWLTREEAARALWAAWRFREQQKGEATERRSRRHVARFIVVALYTGRRAGAIVQASLQPAEDRGWIDLRRGMFFPRPGLAQTKKRQPPIPLPRRLVAHLRRWKRAGLRSAVEWNGEPVKRISKAFRATMRDAGLKAVTPHTLRHTAATWMMQRAADPWAASGYLGMSLETLLRTYGHHHPDHLRAAWSVFDRPGGEPKVRHRVATETSERKVKAKARQKPKTRVRRRSR